MATDLLLIDRFLIIFIGMGPVKVLLVSMEATKGVDAGRTGICAVTSFGNVPFPRY